MDSLTQARGATELSLPNKVIAVLMSLILALGLSPLGQAPTQAWADDGDDEPTAAQTYKVTIDENIEHGTVEADNPSPAMGDTVTLTVTPERGYELDELSIIPENEDDGIGYDSVEDGYGCTATFGMPQSNVTVIATFKKVECEVEIDDEIENGTVKMLNKSPSLDDVINLAVTPDEGYQLDVLEVSINGNQIEWTETTEGTYTFKLTERYAYVNASFTERTYDIIAPNDIANGRVEAYWDDESASYAPAGRTILVAVVPESGYKVETATYSYKDEDGNTVTEPLAVDGEEDYGYGYRFVMPVADVTLNATFVPKAYSVTTNTVSHAAIECDPRADEGETVFVWVNPDSGYRIGAVYYTVNGEDFMIDDWSDYREDGSYLYIFEMPADNVTVGAMLQQKKYAIELSSTENGYLIANDSRADTDETVWLIAHPDPGYKATDVAYSADGGETWISVNPDEDDPNYFWFSMPDSDVIVRATFVQKAHAITVPENIEHGSLEASDARADAGETVWVCRESSEYGYKVTSVTYTYTDSNGKSITENAAFDEDYRYGDGYWIFQMPDAPVTLNAKFERYYDIYTGYDSDYGEININTYEPIEGETVTITVSPIVEYGVDTISAYYEQDDEVTDNSTYVDVPLTSKGDGVYTLVMPPHDVTVSCTFKTLTALDIEPTAVTGLVYNGSVQAGIAPNPKFAIEGGTATDAGTYTAYVKPADGYMWADKTTTAKPVTWSIAKKTVAAPTGVTGLVYNGATQVGVPENAAYTLSGTAKAANAGTYSATATPTANYQFAGGKATAPISWSIARADISKAAVTMATASAAYTGKNQTAGVKSVVVGGRTLTLADYTAVAATGKAVGSYDAVVTGIGNYTGTAKGTFTITQAKNTAKAKSTSVKKSYKVKNLKKKAATIALPKVTTKFGTAKWKVSTKDKKKVLSLSGSKIKVKKGAKKGTYTIKLKASVAKTKNYTAATTKVVTVKVTVKK